MIMKDDISKILAFLASSAMGCLDEPAIYGPLRLLETIELVIRCVEKHNLTNMDGLIQIADSIAINKTLCMEDKEAFSEFVNRIGIEIVKII